MRLKLFRGCLFVFGIVICLPILAVVLGSLKSGKELSDALSPIIGTTGGLVRWHFRVIC